MATITQKYFLNVSKKEEFLFKVEEGKVNTLLYEMNITVCKLT